MLKLTLRALFGMVALVVVTNCAHAQTRASDQTAAQAVAHVIVQAIPEERYAAWGASWGALSSRVSGVVLWHIYAPDPRDRELNEIVERRGWMGVEGDTVEVIVRGVDWQVIDLSFDLDGAPPEALFDALRAEGATLSFEGDDESSMYYWLTTPGRTGARLGSARICTREGSAVMRRCRNVATLYFEMQETATRTP